MIDFLRLDDEALVAFVDSNFAVFAADRSEEFPANVLAKIATGAFAFIRRREGFAIAYKGRLYTPGPGGVEADLMFIYVDPLYEGRGIGKQLVDQVKAAVTPDLPIVLKCAGQRRKAFFEQCGFRAYEYIIDIDTYAMVWMPNTLAA